jgi:Ca-activated chloride channel family protein
MAHVATMMKYSSVIAGFGLFLLLSTMTAGNSQAAEHPDSLYRQARYKEAMTGYEKLDLDNPKDLSYRFNRGCAAYQLKDYQSALAAFTSVYTRAQDNDLRFKAAYNLGNTGYEAGDFRAAADYYKEAIRLNPNSTDVRHNLELALHKLEEAKKQDQNKEQNQGQQCKNPQSKDAQQGKEQKDGQNKQDKQGGQQQQKQAQQGDKGDQQQGQAGQKPKDEPKNLSGELTASTPGQLAKSQEGQKEGQPAKSVERNKAEALLNNIQEDRSRYLRMAPGEKSGVKSGKYW